MPPRPASRGPGACHLRDTAHRVMAGKAEGRTQIAPALLGRFTICEGYDEAHYRRTAETWAGAQFSTGAWFICEFDGAWWAMPPGALADAARVNPEVSNGYDYETDT